MVIKLLSFIFVIIRFAPPILSIIVGSVSPSPPLLKSKM